MPLRSRPQRENPALILGANQPILAERTPPDIGQFRDGLSCAQLARWAFVTPQAMNLVIGALERRALIRRRPDPNHGRVLRASVTPKGLKTLDRCDRDMDAIESDMLGDLPPETIDTVREALWSCAHALEATLPVSRPRAVPRRRD